MRRGIIGYGMLLVLLLAGAAKATNVSGSVSGMWTLSGSPYNLVGNCTIAQSSSLAVESGVVVNFASYSLTLNGTVDASGVSFAGQTNSSGVIVGATSNVTVSGSSFSGFKIPIRLYPGAGLQVFSNNVLTGNSYDVIAIDGNVSIDWTLPATWKKYGVIERTVSVVTGKTLTILPGTEVQVLVYRL